jgi:hypothetical protein
MAYEPRYLSTARVAATAGITVLELAVEQTSLEDAFVDLTKDAVEFRAAARPALKEKQ